MKKFINSLRQMLRNGHKAYTDFRIRMMKNADSRFLVLKPVNGPEAGFWVRNVTAMPHMHWHPVQNPGGYGEKVTKLGDGSGVIRYSRVEWSVGSFEDFEGSYALHTAPPANHAVAAAATA